MGSTVSKTASKTATGAARRKYPQRVPPSPTSNAPPTAPGSTVHPQSQASSTQDETINLDISDPQFARSLRSLGPVTPSSTLSNSSTFSTSPSTPSEPHSPNNQYQQIFPSPSQNPALLVLTARSRLAAEAETEFARARGGGDGGRRFLDVSTIRQVLVMRDEKRVAAEDIQRHLGLGTGVVGRLRCVAGVKVGKVGGEDAGLY